MQRGLTGYFLPIPSPGEECRAFVPHPLPPEPALVLDVTLQQRLERATLALGRLDGLTAVLPDPALFMYSYVRKEAVLSSQIEGTQSSLSDLLRFENEATPGVPLNDVQEVSNYVVALNHGVMRLRDGMPLSLRLLKEVHAILLGRGRGSEKEPGEFRHSQNWIGGTRPGNALFVPPPPQELLNCLGAWENFLHDKPGPTPLLIKAALAHVQFETIHPFLDGNGRVGRLLIALLLHSGGALREPLLYLSLYFKQHRGRYYELLQQVRLTGDWEAWLDFFFSGVEQTANQAAATAHDLLKLASADEVRIQTLGRASGSALRVHGLMQKTPITSIAAASTGLQLTVPAVTSALERLQKLGIVAELTGGRRNRLFAYSAFLDRLNAEESGSQSGS